MPINHDAASDEYGDPVERSWDSKDSLLYSVGVGAGSVDPTGFELEFTTENSKDVTQRALPTLGVILGFGAGMRNLGSFNPAMLVHGEQGIELHREIPVEGTILTPARVTGVYDKGSGAVVALESKSDLKDTGEPLFTVTASMFIRGEGGWGGDRGPSGPAERAAGPRARPRRHLRDPHRPGAHLPPVGRPQPVALRPRVRQARRLPEADPARPVHLRVHRPRAAALAVRLRPGAVHEHGGPVLEAGVPRRLAHGEDVGRRQRSGVHHRDPERRDRHRRRPLRFRSTQVRAPRSAARPERRTLPASSRTGPSARSKLRGTL